MEIKQLIQDYLECKAKLKELNDKKDNLKTLIETKMAMEDTTILQCESGIAKLQTYTRKSIDNSKVKDFCEETGQDINYFYKETEVTQLKVELTENVKE